MNDLMEETPDVGRALNAPTAAVLRHLRRAWPQLRNMARLWLRCWLAEGRALSTPEMADTLGRAHHGGSTTKALQRLESFGLLERHDRRRGCWGRARPGNGLSPAALLAALGPDLEDFCPGRASQALNRSPASHECPECGMAVSPSRAGGDCPLCRILEHRPPGHLARLRYLAERAEKGLPLFRPAPPWVAEAARDVPPRRPAAVLLGLPEEDDEMEDAA